MYKYVGIAYHKSDPHFLVFSFVFTISLFLQKIFLFRPKTTPGKNYRKTGNSLICGNSLLYCNFFFFFCKNWETAKLETRSRELCSFWFSNNFSDRCKRENTISSTDITKIERTSYGTSFGLRALSNQKCKKKKVAILIPVPVSAPVFAKTHLCPLMADLCPFKKSTLIRVTFSIILQHCVHNLCTPAHCIPFECQYSASKTRNRSDSYGEREKDSAQINPFLHCTYTSIIIY